MAKTKHLVIASEAKQSQYKIIFLRMRLLRFARNDG